MILYIEDPKDATRKLLELINEFGKVAGYKINTHKSVAFLYSKTKDQKEKSRSNSIYHLIKKNKIPRNKSILRGKGLVLTKLYDIDERN